jgi:tetratricopeptide (TPR) repeat protein
MKGDLLLAQGGHLPQAQAAFRIALERAPKWWNPYRGLADVELDRDNRAAAASVLKEAATRAQLSEAQRLELALLLARSGQGEEAIKQYEIALKLNPKSQAAAGGLAMLLVLFRTDEVSLNRAATLVQPFAASSDWRLLDAFGWVQLKNEDLGRALPALQKAAAQRPDSPLVRFHLAMAELKSGQKSLAEKDLAEAVARNTPFFGHDQAHAVLAQLRNNKSDR